MRRGRRARRGRTLIGAALIGLVGLALAAFALAGFFLRAPPTDPETLCRTDSPPAAHTLILVDSTDRLERRHRRRLDALALQERARLGHYDRLTILRIDARRPHEPTIIFSKCLPKPPELANPLFENPADALETWNADFADGLARALRSAASGGRQRSSPIIAGLRAAAGDPTFTPDIAARRLVVVSDFLEHDPRGFSHYAADTTYSRWASDDPRGAPDLAGVSVRLAPIDRPEQNARQADALADFWPQFFADSGAEPVSIDPSF